MIFDDTITIFNYYKDKEGNDCWKRTIIDKAMWKSDLVKSIADGVISVATLHKVTILIRDNYLSPKEFALKTDKSDYWTLNTQSNMDVIVFGKVDRNINNTNYTINDLLADYEKSGTISAVRDNTNMAHLKNWKVSLK